MGAIAAHRAGAGLATRLVFLTAGFITGCWAPLIPFAKARLGVNDAGLGLLLLCAAAGSLVGASSAGPLAARIGARLVILAGGLGLCVMLPALTAIDIAVAFGLALFVFGASLGALDVAMNAHAVDVESAAAVPLMSGFHAHYSLGGIAGAGLITLLLLFRASPFAASLCASAAALAALAIAAPRLLAARPRRGGAAFAWPTGVVLVIAGLAAVSFLAEGAVLDWGALLIVARRLAGAKAAGLGFALFSIAMTVGRLTGDRVVARLGRRRVLAGGGAIAMLGFATVLTLAAPLAVGGFLLVGLGLANIVPVLFSAAGRQRVMAPSLAIAAITTTGYVGILAGPPLIGFVAHATSLATSFWLLTALIALAPLLAGPAAQ